MTENRAFTERCIAELQKASIAAPKAQAMTRYLMRHKRLAYDDAHDLFWVSPVTGQPQVAVWMMPVVRA